MGRKERRPPTEIAACTDRNLELGREIISCQGEPEKLQLSGKDQRVCWGHISGFLGYLESRANLNHRRSGQSDAVGDWPHWSSRNVHFGISQGACGRSDLFTKETEAENSSGQSNLAHKKQPKCRCPWLRDYPSSQQLAKTGTTVLTPIGQSRSLPSARAARYPLYLQTDDGSIALMSDHPTQQTNGHIPGPGDGRAGSSACTLDGEKTHDKSPCLGQDSQSQSSEKEREIEVRSSIYCPEAADCPVPQTPT
ncbi:hypothetical protein RRG08_007535 [Elysia crispata]|uniref:Uncharacterized protein n=1 Tax=Elysia crispata TaxID=231223 RepID=A0AAE1CXE2_9GAST|nr:hypothetical protein RRG08_007535 [Elysia crispata]